MKTSKTIGLCRSRRTYTLGRTRDASPSEQALGLALKLHEEVAEVTRAPTDVCEYADVLQALMDYATFNGVRWASVTEARVKKAAKDGTFIPSRIWEAKKP